MRLEVSIIIEFQFTDKLDPPLGYTFKQKHSLALFEMLLQRKIAPSELHIAGLTLPCVCKNVLAIPSVFITMLSTRFSAENEYIRNLRRRTYPTLPVPSILLVNVSSTVVGLIRYEG